jgi:hypothetical protein
MKLMKACGALVVLGLLLAAVAPAAMAAEPALYECAKLAKNATTKKYEGKYTDKKCSNEATEAEKAEGKKNKYELKEGIGKGKAFKGKGGGANLEIVTLGGVTCTSSADGGKFTGPKTAGGVFVTFKGCELSGHKCENTGKAGEVKTNTLEGVIGYINKSKHEVGVDLSAETGSYEAEFTCGELEIRVSGSVIGAVVSPLNVFTKVATLSFTQSAGRQHVQNLEGRPKDTLVSEIAKAGTKGFGEALESGESTEVTNKGEELELKA